MTPRYHAYEVNKKVHFMRKLVLGILVQKHTMNTPREFKISQSLLASVKRGFSKSIIEKDQILNLLGF